jgi:hypothetical protein
MVLYTKKSYGILINIELHRTCILVNERAGSLSSLGLDVLTKPNELSAQCALASRAETEKCGTAINVLQALKSSLDCCRSRSIYEQKNLKGAKNESRCPS